MVLPAEGAAGHVGGQDVEPGGDAVGQGVLTLGAVQLGLWHLVNQL